MFLVVSILFTVSDLFTSINNRYSSVDVRCPSAFHPFVSHCWRNKKSFPCHRMCYGKDQTKIGKAGVVRSFFAFFFSQHPFRAGLVDVYQFMDTFFQSRSPFCIEIFPRGFNDFHPNELGEVSRRFGGPAIIFGARERKQTMDDQNQSRRGKISMVDSYLFLVG